MSELNPIVPDRNLIDRNSTMIAMHVLKLSIKDSEFALFALAVIEARLEILESKATQAAPEAPAPALPPSNHKQRKPRRKAADLPATPDPAAGTQNPPAAPSIPKAPIQEKRSPKEDLDAMRKAVEGLTTIKDAISAIVKAGFTQTLLAKHLGIDSAAISHASRSDKTWPYVERAFKQYFGIPPVAQGPSISDAEATRNEIYQNNE